MSLHSPGLFNGDKPAGFDGLFNWEFVADALRKATGRNVAPMDIDAHVEINGQHLMIETKRPDAPIPGGQKQALAQLWAKGHVMLLFIWGKEFPVQYAVWYPSGRKVPWTDVDKEPRGLERAAPIARAELEAVIAKWVKWAEGKPCPFQYNGQ